MVWRCNSNLFNPIVCVFHVMDSNNMIRIVNVV